MNMICENLTVGQDGTLYFGGHNTVTLLKKYGSPLYLLDEERIRHNCRTYVKSMKKHFGDSALPLYASKANSFRQLYRIVASEGMGSDVVSAGEIYTALSAGFPMDKVYFHGNNKTDADIAYAIESGVGCFVVDNREELAAIEREASARGHKQKVLLRLTPGIDPHTYEAVATGKVDSKFGSAIVTGAAEEILREALSLSHIDLCGFHCHVGSQVFDSEVYIASAEIMLEFMAAAKARYGLITRELNLGGGYGVRYTDKDPVLDIDARIGEVARVVKALCDKKGLALPDIRMEPGRSIVADAGLTLYTVGTVKRIEGFKSYVSIDGGMTDNPRYALYRSSYTVLAANKMKEATTFPCSLVGRCCESGDILQENILLPESIARGDVIAVLTTGAYNYAMSSNYNRICRLPTVMVNRKEAYVAVRRESLEDLTRNDL